jgi:hypothetical protein
MADYGYFWGAANDNEWVIDIKGASPASGAALDAFPQKPDCNDNQLWASVQSSVLNPSGSGDTYYYFLQSKLNPDNVITANGNAVEATKKKSPDSKEQLWEFSPPFGFFSSDGLSYSAIQSAKDGRAITIPEGTKKSAPLQLASLSNGENQAWIFQAGAPGYVPGVQTMP